MSGASHANFCLESLTQQAGALTFMQSEIWRPRWTRDSSGAEATKEASFAIILPFSDALLLFAQNAGQFLERSFFRKSMANLIGMNRMELIPGIGRGYKRDHR
jgi:hypothetical protein